MFYPDEFKKRVKKAYPDLELLHEKLDKGDDFVYLYLQSITCLPCVLDLYPGALSLATVLEATSLEELKKRSMDERRAIEHYKVKYSTDRNVLFESRYEALKTFYPDKKVAKSLFTAPWAFPAVDILHSRSFIVLHEEALLRQTRINLVSECNDLYNSQNS